VITNAYAACLIAAGSLLIATGSTVAATIEQKMGEVALMHGGVGLDDRATMAQARSHYNLRLTFATKGSGAYLSGTRVQIDDRQGTTRVDTIASGPWLFVRVPAGEYAVSATQGQQTLQHKVSIDNAPREWVFRFDAPPGAY
jgi:hypothetical protein